MIAEEFLACSLGLELNSDAEPEEKTDEDEEESTESPKEAAEDVAQVGDFSSYISNVLYVSWEFSQTEVFPEMWRLSCSLRELRASIHRGPKSFHECSSTPSTSPLGRDILIRDLGWCLARLC